MVMNIWMKNFIVFNISKQYGGHVLLFAEINT